LRYWGEYGGNPATLRLGCRPRACQCNIDRSFAGIDAVAELHYQDTAALQTELSRFKRLAAAVGPPFTECFFAEPSPGIIATTILNAYYPSHEAYLEARSGGVPAGCARDFGD